jgi:hypothetical protein
VIAHQLDDEEPTDSPLLDHVNATWLSSRSAVGGVDPIEVW